jgi:hypothetical protein
VADGDDFLGRAAAESGRRRGADPDVPWELRGSGTAPVRHPGAVERESSHPVWVRAAAVIALVALLGLALAGIF